MGWGGVGGGWGGVGGGVGGGWGGGGGGGGGGWGGGGGGWGGGGVGGGGGVVERRAVGVPTERCFYALGPLIAIKRNNLKPLHSGNIYPLQFLYI